RRKKLARAIDLNRQGDSVNRHYLTALRLLIVDLIFNRRRRSRRKIRRSLCQRQLLLQKRKLKNLKLRQQRKKIFYRFMELITSSFMSATPSKRRISTRPHSGFKAWHIPGRKPG